MDRVKSALEIALEKTAHLKRASADELRQQKEEEVNTLSRGIVSKYLRGEYKLKDMIGTLERSEEKALLTQALWEQLTAAISLNDCDAIFEGLELLAQDKESVRQAASEVKKISQAFLQKRERSLQTLERKAEQSFREQLAQNDIAGGAVEIDVKSTSQWQQALQEVEAPFQSRLEKVKQALGCRSL